MSEHPRKPLDEALREALAPGAAPMDLRGALLAEARRQDGGLARSRSLRPWFAAAAALLILSGGAGLALRQRPAEPLRTARGALKNYLEVHGLEFQGREVCADTCGKWSRERLGFEAPLPRACAGQPMRGGRACEVDGRPVAHYILEDGRALYVFQQPLNGGDCQPERALAMAAGLQAKAWNEAGRGYVLLEPAEGRR
jgi:hypothetical protein